MNACQLSLIQPIPKQGLAYLRLYEAMNADMKTWLSKRVRQQGERAVQFRLALCMETDPS